MTEASNPASSLMHNLRLARKSVKWIMLLLIVAAPIVCYTQVGLPLGSVDACKDLILTKLKGISLPGTGGISTYSGFSKLLPQPATARMDGMGLFNCSFLNGIGTDVLLNKSAISVVDPNFGRCSLVSLDKSRVAAGEAFRITASCRPAKDRQMYALRVSIPYDVRIGAQKNRHLEEGTLRGFIR